MDPPGAQYMYDDGEAQRRDQVAVGILLELQRNDPATVDGPSRSLALASPDGRTVTSIAQSTEGLLGYHQPSKESVLIFYVSRGAARVLDADVATGRVRSDLLLEQ